MYWPGCSSFHTYAVELEPQLAAYRDQILNWPLMREWTDAAVAEPDEIVELEIEFRPHFRGG